MLDDPRETTLENHYEYNYEYKYEYNYEYGHETDRRQKPETKANQHYR
jgi:hypothetical protein